MRNKVGPGDTITITVDEDVVSGQGVVFGNLFGVASTDAKAGEPCAFDTVNVYALPKLDTVDISQFALIYWNKTDKQCVTTASGNVLIGIAVGAAPSGTGTVNVRLNGIASK